MGEKGAVMGEKSAVKKEKGSDTEQKAPFLVRGASSWAGRAPYLVPRALSQAEREFFVAKGRHNGRKGRCYPAPHWGIFITRPTGGGGYFEPPSDLRNYWADSKNSNGI